MSVILRQAETGLYYTGRGCWVNNPRSALDLETVEHAVETGRAEHVGEVQIVAQFEHPAVELVFPVQLNGTSNGGARQVEAAVGAYALGYLPLHYPGSAPLVPAP